MNDRPAVPRASSAPPDRLRRAHRLLHQTFRLPHCRPGQEEVIRHVMAGHDTLAVMATGAGKSLCYQLPALLLPGRTVVISPLIALMKDQHDHLRALGIPVAQRHSSQLAAEADKAETAVMDGSARIVFTTPERLGTPDFLKALRSHPVSLLVIDEAHCVSEWGHDFRPAFLDIGQALRQMGRPVVLALTATATAEDVEDVMRQLDLQGLRVVHTGLYRENLTLAVDHVDSEPAQQARLKTLVAGSEGQGIVYTSTVKAAEAVHATLTLQGEAVALYHGHLPRGQRHAEQDRFVHGGARVMVATPAFGMGIDMPAIRFIVHHQLPASLAAYYQSAGRAGRDGLPARCTLVDFPKDRRIQRFFLATSLPSVEDFKTIASLLDTPSPAPEGWHGRDVEAAIPRPRRVVQLALLLLRRHGVIARDRHGVLRTRIAALSEDTLQPLLEAHAARKRHEHAMLEAMVDYCQSGRCRWQMLLQHFEPDAAPVVCGHCDNCARRSRAQAAADEAPPDPGDTSPVPVSPRDFSVGDPVRVPRYGRGHVVAMDDVGITVRFPNGPERSFLPAYVRGA